MRDGNSVLLVDTEQHLRLLVAEEVDQAVMQAAIARARRQGDVFKADFTQDRRDRIATPSHGRVALLHWLFDSFHPCPIAATGTWTGVAAATL